MSSRIKHPHNAFPLERYDAVFDPDTIAAHHVGQHHVGGQPVSNNSDLAGTGDSSLWVLLEIVHDLGGTTGLFGLVREHIYTCCFLKRRSQFSFGIVTASTGSVRNNEETPAGVCRSQCFEAFLSTSASGAQQLLKGRKRYLVWCVDLVGFWNGKAVILVQNDCLNIDLLAILLQGIVEGDGKIPKGWDDDVGQT